MDQDTRIRRAKNVVSLVEFALKRNDRTGAVNTVRDIMDAIYQAGVEYGRQHDSDQRNPA